MEFYSYEEEKKLVDAEKCYKRCIEIDPGNQECKDNLKSLYKYEIFIFN